MSETGTTDARGSETPPGTLSRRLLRQAATGTLATLMKAGRSGESGDLAGWPHASMVLVAAAPDGTPVLLLSDLAQHSANASADDRVALAVAGSMTPAGGAARTAADPLAGPRASLLGRLAPPPAADDAALRARFLARHPQAAGYAAFADFRLWTLQVEAAHLVAGFGRIAWATGGQYRFAGPTAALAAAEAGIVDHMNADHADAIALYATILCGAPPADWRMTGCDPEGIDMRAGDGTGPVLRLDFDAPIADAAAARAALVALVQRARAAGGAGDAEKPA
ncbi:HugZ family protein [Marinibaculum pumilum]|uniref:HugZ family protein n=1 Tax=Marinibaculum pumilum TaxID=1766165 RepID=A0ABV7L0F6_9PROT